MGNCVRDALKVGELALSLLVTLSLSKGADDTDNAEPNGFALCANLEV